MAARRASPLDNFRRREGSTHRFEQDVADRDVAVMLVCALDDVPGCDVGRRFAQGVLPQVVVLAVLARARPVGGSDLPGCALVAIERGEAALLVGLGEMDPELDEHDALAREHPFGIAYEREP